MTLSSTQRESLQRDGFLIFPGAVSPKLVDDARHLINWRMGQGIDPALLTQYGAQSFFPELKTAPPIRALANESGLTALVRSLLNETAPETLDRAQIALRFPREPGSEPKPPHPHVDGTHSKNNGVPEGELHSFSALLGIFLSDVETEFAGNFSVWPGTHLQLEAAFKKEGTRSILYENRLPQIEWPQPIQIRAKAGDAVICHHLLAHGITPNHSPNIRYATFFRIWCRDHWQNREAILTDIWREWKGLSKDEG